MLPILENKVIIKIIDKNKLTDEVYSFLSEKIRKETINNRICNKSCDLFVAYLKGNTNPIGYYWAITCKYGNEWHDSFKISEKSSLLFNAFVSEDCRNFGVYSQLISYAQDYLFKTIGIININTIVEQKNTPSLKANLKTGSKIIGVNHLLKFFGFNVFSIFQINHHLSFYFAPFYLNKSIK
jgi:hypothetical protein